MENLSQPHQTFFFLSKNICFSIMKRCTKISIEESRGKKKQQFFFIDKSGVQVRTFFWTKGEIWNLVFQNQ